MATNSSPPGRGFDMRALWRLAIWGTSAVVALSVAVLAGNSETGSRRLMALSGGTSEPAQKTAMAAPLTVRSAEAEAETRRLAESVRMLASDRERLVARIGVLERNLEDVTGSIRRQTPPIPGPIPPAGTTANAPDSPSTPAHSAGAPSAAPRTPAPERAVTLPERAPSAPATEPPPPAPAEPAQPAAANAEGPRADIGVDIGGAVSFDGLRSLWVATKNHNAALLEGLHPIITVRENNRSKAPELRLIIGPFETAEAASRLCATLSASRRYCQPVAFEGQRLAQADDTPVPVPERKPASPKPAPAKPAQQAPRSAWPFR